MSDKADTANNLLIDTAGRPRFGHFDSPISDLGIKDFHYLNTMDKPASRLAKFFNYKQFQFVSINTGRYLIGLAITDIRYVGSAFCYVYDVENQQLTEETWLRPLGLAYQVSPSPTQGQAFIGHKGSKIGFNIIDGLWQLSIETPHIKAELKLTPADKSRPLAMCSPTGYNGWTYTQKHNCLSVSGTLQVNGESQNLDLALSGYDFSAGFMRRETSWRWTSINAHTESGRLGLNLAAGVNETGSVENVFWLNGRRQYLPAVHFDFQRLPTNGVHQWQIYSDNGQVDLHFTADNQRSEKLNLLFLKSNFRQFIGHFDGKIIDEQGHEIPIKNVFGLTEDHFARW
ncbi:MAG: DUF2804 domain-containing protein [Pseudomonadales bacterium]|nr:DUF2804 domain-containing protein [Pseudomonadales bacterium]